MSDLKFLLILTLFAFIITSLYAHEEESNFGKDSTGNKQGYSDSFSLNKKNNKQNFKQGDYLSLFTAQHALGHLHNKVVHFPIAVGIAAFVLSLLQFKWKDLDRAILILVAIAAVGGTVAYFTGTLQGDTFKDYNKYWILDFHEDLGTITTFLIWGWLIMLLAKPLKKYAWIGGLIVFIAVALTGYVGGVLAH